MEAAFSTHDFSFRPTQSAHFATVAILGKAKEQVHRAPMREASFLCQQLPWPTFAREGAGVFAHEFDIPKMNQAGIEGDVNHDLEKSLVCKIVTESGVVVSH